MVLHAFFGDRVLWLFHVLFLWTWCCINSLEIVFSDCSIQAWSFTAQVCASGIQLHLLQKNCWVGASSECRDALKAILATSFFCGYGLAWILWRLCFVIVPCSVGAVRGKTCFCLWKECVELGCFSWSESDDGSHDVHFWNFVCVAWGERTLCVLHGVRGGCSGFASSCAQCCGFCSWWTIWKWQRLTVNMLASEHHLHAKCLVQVAHPWHLWKHCGHCFICWRDCPCEWSRRPRRPMPWKFGCRSNAVVWPGAVNGSRGPWKKFPHWSFAKWQVLGMLGHCNDCVPLIFPWVLHFRLKCQHFLLFVIALSLVPCLSVQNGAGRGQGRWGRGNAPQSRWLPASAWAWKNWSERLRANSSSVQCDQAVHGA